MLVFLLLSMNLFQNSTDVPHTTRSHLQLIGGQGFGRSDWAQADVRCVLEQVGSLCWLLILEGKKPIPFTVSNSGLRHCCDHTHVKDMLATAIRLMDEIQTHIMAWPSVKASHHTPRQAVGLAPLSPRASPPFVPTTSFNLLATWWQCQLILDEM